MSLRGWVRYWAGGAAITLGVLVVLVIISAAGYMSQSLLLAAIVGTLLVVHLYGRYIGLLPLRRR